MRFSAVGTAGFLVDSAVLVLLTDLIGLNPFLARVPSFLAAATFTWWVNRSWTFQHSFRSPVAWQWLRYLLAMKVGAAVNFMVFALALILSNFAYQNPVLGVALGSIAGLAVNYLMASRLIFRPANDGQSASGSDRLFDQRAIWILAACMPVLFGMLSLLRGQDLNWDLLNYHLYVPYAWLEGRHNVDLAAAQMQSYFPSLIDLPYFMMIQFLPGPVVAFLMGLLHGLVFIPLFMISRHFVSWKAAFFISLVACLGSAWLSGLGTTMGDNLACLGIILTFLLLLPIVRGDPSAMNQPFRWLLAAGLVLGLFVGLKLTNAVFAVAVLLAFSLSCPGDWGMRLKFVLFVGLSALVGLIASAGYWFHYLWMEFGNPLFPQFNHWFGGPLASSTGIVDQSRVPERASQVLLWPLKLLTDPDHFSEVGQRSLLWLVLVLAAVWWFAQQLIARVTGQPRPTIKNTERFLLLCLLFGFALWAFTFSIFRYLAGLELLAPLAVWVLIRYAAARRVSDRLNPMVLSLLALAGLVGSESWGHGRLGWDSVTVEVPELERPQERVLILVGDQPQSWRLPWWPEDVAFVGLGGNFPESELFRTRVIDQLRSRPGPHLAMLPAFHRRGEARLEKVNTWLAVRRVPAQGWLCRFLDRLASERELNLTIRSLSDRDQDRSICQLYSTAVDKDHVTEITPNQDIARQSAELMRRYGLNLQASSCQVHASRLGDRNIPYQVCPVTLAR